MKGEVISEDRRQGCGCCTVLTLECPVLAVSPFTESVFHCRFSSYTEIVIQASYIELNFAGNVITLNSTFARIVINSCYLWCFSLNIFFLH